MSGVRPPVPIIQSGLVLGLRTSMETVVDDVPGSARVPPLIIYHLGSYIGSLVRYVKTFFT
jgi:hypothetical protein